MATRFERTVTKRTLVLALGLFLCSLPLASHVLFYEPATSGGKIVVLDEPFHLIGHAGVGLEVGRYTNSREALAAAVARGIDTIEIDFIQTRDGELVAGHDWQSVYLELYPGLSRIPPSLSAVFKPKIPSKAEFEASSMRDGLTGFDPAYLVRWLERHPQVRIVSDTKDDNLAMLRKLVRTPGLPVDRFIVQIYNRDELEPVRKLGFGSVIYTLYKEPDMPVSTALAFTKDHGLSLTIPEERATQDVFSQASKAGVKVYVHTINTRNDALRLRGWGASGVYTDFLVPVQPNGDDDA